MHPEHSNPTPEHVQSTDPPVNWFHEAAQWMLIDNNGDIKFEMIPDSPEEDEKLKAEAGTDSVLETPDGLENTALSASNHSRITMHHDFGPAQAKIKREDLGSLSRGEETRFMEPRPGWTAQTPVRLDSILGPNTRNQRPGVSAYTQPGNAFSSPEQNYNLSQGVFQYPQHAPFPIELSTHRPQDMDHPQPQSTAAVFLRRLNSVDRISPDHTHPILPSVPIQGYTGAYYPLQPTHWPPKMTVDYIPGYPPSPYLREGLPNWHFETDQFNKSFRALGDPILHVDSILSRNSRIEKNNLWKTKPPVALGSALYALSYVESQQPAHHHQRSRYQGGFFHQGPYHQGYQQQQGLQQQPFKRPVFRQPLSPPQKTLGRLPLFGQRVSHDQQNHFLTLENSTLKASSWSRKKKGGLSLLDARMARQREGYRRSLRVGGIQSDN
ncbi:uncharacterized protein LAJ45_08913 [Morchella importuna]|uniref:uncharacterized protein n=1 Tax=Morchella importuna TaxID=1174673 RepID=UPI001E8CE494|nr:uncharacterized protein LAJ45_08913 [Morchella importuna]KAH8147113.1 hypothetical protein LAJ45_08913 [Morchella importuna]